MFNAVQNEQPIDVYVIIERQYSKQAMDLLYYKIADVLSLEELLKIEIDSITNIVDVDQAEFDSGIEHLNRNLFGNVRFKQRLKEELTKYRVFDRIGQQPIFSLLICGSIWYRKNRSSKIVT